MGFTLVHRSRATALVVALVLIALVTPVALAAAPHTSGPFQGAKANKGTVMHTKEGGKNMLVLSDDFVVPDTPDPHWQLVDSKGNVYLVDRLPLKGDKVARSIEIPAYVHDVAKVQIWCAFAESVLGEASFSQPVR